MSSQNLNTIVNNPRNDTANESEEEGINITGIFTNYCREEEENKRIGIAAACVTPRGAAPR